MSDDVRRIAVYGPESTGKTELAAKLAAHYGAPLVPECAREFWDAHGAITLGDIPTIAREQWRREDAAAETAAHAAGRGNPSDDLCGAPPSGGDGKCNPIGYKTAHRQGEGGAECNPRGYEAAGGRTPMIVCDTEALTTVLWSDLLYGTCPDEVRRGAEQRCRGYALYLLCDIDVPFAPDPQRCFPDGEDRRRCMKVWHGALERRALPYVWIRGGWAERERAAISAVEELLRRGG